MMNKVKPILSFIMKKVLLPQKWSFLFWSVLALFLSLFWYKTFYIVFSQIQKMDRQFFAIEIKKIDNINGNKNKKEETDYLVDYIQTNKRPLDWVSLRHMPKYVPQAFVVSEDSYFYKHPGYDLEAMRLALKEAVTQKKKLRGASTINQQLAKNLFLSRDRNLTRKGLEFIYAVYMNKVLKKSTIMEHYLNIIEFGPGLYGIGKAAKFYFKKNAAYLNPKEAAFLAMLLPNPKKYSQSYRMQKLSGYARKSVQRTLRKLLLTGHLSSERYLGEISTPLPFEQSQLDDYQDFLTIAKREISIPVDDDREDNELGALAAKEETEELISDLRDRLDKVDSGTVEVDRVKEN